MLRRLGIQTLSKRERISLTVSTVVALIVTGNAIIDIVSNGVRHFWWLGYGNIAIGVFGLWIWVIFHRQLSKPKGHVFRCMLGISLALVMLFDVVAWFANIYNPGVPIIQFSRPAQSIFIAIMFILLFCHRN